MAVLITVLIVTCIALAVGCGFLAWLWAEQRKTIGMLARTLLTALEDGQQDQRRRWLRAVESGDVSRLPVPGGPDE